jgi:H/ACA ribonucleoprotein complex non-core subunit NAF1
MSFKIPDHIPQDLLLIHGFIGESTLPKFQKLALASPNVDCIDSSDSDNASEDEIEADLMVATGDNELIVPKPTYPISRSSIITSE